MIDMVAYGQGQIKDKLRFLDWVARAFLDTPTRNQLHAHCQKAILPTDTTEYRLPLDRRNPSKQCEDGWRSDLTRRAYLPLVVSATDRCQPSIDYASRQESVYREAFRNAIHPSSS